MNKIGSNRSFGIVFFIVFLLISIWPLINEQNIRVWSLVVAIIFLTLGLLNSNILTPLNFVWIKFGEKLGAIIAPLILGLIYFIVVTPIGLLMRLIGKDLLKINFSSSDTYWVKRRKKAGSMKRQF
tara:strand:+ start:196 stop:573 length:378 start_codon:yes stop_codon:yes gene_type:complete